MSSRSQLIDITPSSEPKHVAIIMDGNGRWAKQRGKLRVFGHRAGVKAVRKSVRFAVEQGLQALTLYAFSSENWQRPAQEVSALMELFVHALENEVKSLHKHQVRLRVIGDKSRFSPRLQQRIAQSEALTADNQRLTLNIAANYGGRWDIVQGVKQWLMAAEQQQLTIADVIADVDEQGLAQYLCLQQSPPVDLVIRTGGEHRISNFLLWQIAYAELYFTETLWPDFDEAVFAQAITAFSQRERRFGGANPDLTTI